MADPLKHRTPPLQPLPPDKAFTPRAAGNEEARSKDSARKAEIEERLGVDAQHAEMTLSNRDKIELWEATAQDLANAGNCSILLHYYAIPHHQHTNPTMRAAFIPADERVVEMPEPPPPEARAR
jgi:hypothetical protein